MLRQLFSSLYSMLPSSKNYLVDGGLSPPAAAYAVIGCFIGGVIGIQVISRAMHHFVPSHIVDCDHTHEEHHEDDSDQEMRDDRYHKQNGFARERNDSVWEDTPLLSRPIFEETDRKSSITSETPALTRRPTFQTRLTGLISGRKTSCAQGGPCLGYSEPCAQECFKAISRSPTKYPSQGKSDALRRPQIGLLRTMTGPLSSRQRDVVLHERDVEDEGQSPRVTKHSEASTQPTDQRLQARAKNGSAFHSNSSESFHDPESQHTHKHGGNPPNDPSSSHHHHVPTNAFLSIGLQTSIAIALHKLPEGFITYATNHANPKLGFSVFMALFIHNITEGFAMALPLYLAINSRWKAMFWSSLLGGVSQPLGAGIAALWFKAAGQGDNAPGERVYGCMFAITAGIMASVALQLFSESLGMTHNRNLCIAFAFAGMGILGISFALTAS